MWEELWKTIWLLVVALPACSSGQMDAPTWGTTTDCMVAVIFPFIIPWRYVWTNYVARQADRWR